jgi:predicted transcriptional regulator
MTVLADLPLSDSTRERLVTLATQSHRTVESVAGEVIESEIGRFQFEQDILDLEADIDAGREPLMSLDEVKQYLGLDS